jgi:oligopeptide/dipeptide ABC transporter ATP-binding protein
VSVRNLCKEFKTPAGTIHAVDNVSFDIAEGHSVAVVGESGCGKTTLAMSFLQLIKPTMGDILFEGQSIAGASQRELMRIRQRIGVVFQDPQSSLNPRMRVGDIVGEPLRVHRGLRGRPLQEAVTALLEDVGMPGDVADRFVHQFSGGQRQRIAIARALALDPSLVVLDEPTSALDVSVQAQVLNLLADLKRDRGVSYLFISHSLATVEYLADTLVVMYLGRIVEGGPAAEIFANPRHPYTRMLVGSVPELAPEARTERILPQGEVPSPINRPAGCPFSSRCPYVMDRCRRETPDARRVAGTDIWAACFLVDETFGELDTTAPA